MESLSKLFGSPARLKLLRLFVFNPESSFTVADAAERSTTPPEKVRRELAELSAAGLIRKKAARGSVRYQLNRQFEHLPALAVFIRETTAVRPARILAGLKKAGTLRFVALAGFFTGMPESQVDLLIVGDVLHERALAKAVRSIEAELGREIRYAAFATPDFRYRRGVYDRLLRDVFDYPHRVLVDKIGA